MPEPLFSFLRPIEAELVKDLARTIHREFGEVRFLEIGVFGGGTTKGLAAYCKEMEYPLIEVGVDCMESYRPVPDPVPGYEFLFGDSMDQWRHLAGRKFNFLFVDGCHCVNHSMTDFLNYSPLVEVGGYCLFHDTALPNGKYEQEAWPQDHGFAGKPPSQLGVREGLQKLGLLQGHRTDWELMNELPSDTGLMGMHFFKKIKAL